MQKTKLALLFDTFSDEDWKAFHNYLHSPYFNNRQQLKDLFHWIRQIHKKGQKEYPDNQYLWEKLFKKQPYKQITLYRLFSLLSKLGEDFLALRQYEGHPFTSSFYLLQSLNERGLYKYYNTLFPKIKEKLSTQILEGSKWYHQQYLLHQTEDRFLKNTAPQQRNPTQLTFSLDWYYLILKLKDYCILLDKSGKQKTSFDQTSLRHFLTYLQGFDWKAIPLLRLYYTTAQTLLYPEEPKHYFALVALLKHFESSIEQTEVLELYNFAQNYCVKRINRGDSAYLKKLFALYQYLLAKEVIVSDGVLNHLYYKNIMVIALRLKEFTWAGEFLHQYKNYILPKHRQNAFYYNSGILHFYRKRYGKSMQAMLKVNDKNPLYILETKACLFKSYYELEETEALLLLAHNFKTYVRRQKQLPDTVRKGYLNMIQLSCRLACINPWEAGKLERLKKKFERSSFLPDGNWLLSKIKEKELSLTKQK